MRLFVRVTNGGNWDNITQNTAEDLTFPSDVLADILDAENEISVWAVGEGRSSDEIDRLIAGLHPPNSSIEIDQLVAALHPAYARDLSDLRFRIITEWKVTRDLGLRMQTTPGITLDNKLNRANRHSIIKVSTVGEAIKLAKAFGHRPPITFNKDEVMRRFVIALEERRIPADKVNVELWGKLITGRHLSVVAKPESAGTIPAPQSPWWSRLFRSLN